MAFNQLGNALEQSGQLEAAESAYEEAARCATESENRRLSAAVNNSLGCLALERGYAQSAREILAKGLALAIPNTSRALLQFEKVWPMPSWHAAT